MKTIIPAFAGMPVVHSVMRRANDQCAIVERDLARLENDADRAGLIDLEVYVDVDFAVERALLHA